MMPNKHKKKSVAVLLWFLSYFGVFGFYNFYLRQYWQGAVKTTLAVLGFAGFAVIMVLSEQDKISFGFAFIPLLMVISSFIWGIVDIIKIALTKKVNPAKSNIPELY